MVEEWDGLLHLGQPEMDLEHQGQVDLLTAFEAELRGPADIVQLTRLLDHLADFTSVHFMSEQLLMRRHAYPAIAAHEFEHGRLMEQMGKLQASFRSGDRDLTLTDLVTLRDWVAEHIRTQDVALSLYLARADGEGEEA